MKAITRSKYTDLPKYEGEYVSLGLTPSDLIIQDRSGGIIFVDRKGVEELLGVLLVFIKDLKKAT